MMNAKKRAVNLILLIVSLTGSLLVCELYLRISQTFWINVPSVHFDPDTEFFNRVNFKSMLRYRHRTTWQTINSNGFRSPEISESKDSESIRLAFVGDSFTYGFNVNDGEEYPSLVISEIQQRKKIDYINAGVENIGISHELAIYEKYVDRFRPDIVILTFCTNNDFEDLYLGPYRIREGVIQKQLLKRKFVYRAQDILFDNPVSLWILRRSFLVSFTREILGKRLNQDRRQLLVEVSSKSDGEIVQDYLQFFRQLQAATQNGNAKLLFVVAPGRYFYQDTVLARRLALLLTELEKLKIPVCDLRPDFEKIRNDDEMRYGSLWLEPDHHWSPEGNRIAAGGVISFLEQEIS